MPDAEPAAPGLYLGLISGTSADGVDSALLRIDARIELLAAGCLPYPEAMRARILEMQLQPDAPVQLDGLAALDVAIGEHFARAALTLLAHHGVAPGAVRAIGSHGQTLRHRPDAEPAFTWQAGDPWRIAEATGIPVVADFRRADVAAGGQGAPLVPAFQQALVAGSQQPVAFLNLGGIANLTVIDGERLLGFDCGPANGLLDAWCASTGHGPMDVDGALAAAGRVQPGLLRSLLDDPYFSRPPPKSTGREHFSLAWLQSRLRGLSCTAADVQATLVALSAEIVGADLARHAPDVAYLYVHGGGLRNPVLRAAIARRSSARLCSTAALGIDPDALEAACFAWLAAERLAGRSGNHPGVTGAHGFRRLGALYQPCG